MSLYYFWRRTPSRKIYNSVWKKSPTPLLVSLIFSSWYKSLLNGKCLCPRVWKNRIKITPSARMLFTSWLHSRFFSLTFQHFCLKQAKWYKRNRLGICFFFKLVKTFNVTSSILLSKHSNFRHFKKRKTIIKIWTYFCKPSFEVDNDTVVL